jgi:4-hydroxybenzoate polyprenyltransferase
LALALLQFLNYSNYYVAFCIAVLSYVSIRLHSGLPERQSLEIALLLFFITHLAYNFLRFPDWLKRRANNDRLQWMADNSRWVFISSICSALGAFLVLVWAELKFILPHFTIPLVLSFLYIVPLIPTKEGRKSLRSIGLLKPVVIALAVTCMSIVIPFRLSKDETDLIQAGVEFASRFIFILCITIPFDIRDSDEDKAMMIKTFPVRFGWKQAKTLSAILAGLYIMLEAWLYLNYFHSGRHFMASGILFGTVLLSVILDIREKSTTNFYAFLVEGTMLIWAFLIYSFVLTGK